MADFMEITGKSVEDAFMNAIIQLETTSDNIAYEVIDKGSSGILGFGSRPAKIKAWVKNKNNEESTEENISAPADVTPVKNDKDKSDKKDSQPVKQKVNSNNEAEKQVKKESKEESKPVSKKEDIDLASIDKIIREFLNNMFGAMNMEVGIDIKYEPGEDCVNVELSGEEMGLLIGKRGQTLDSIQYLISLVVNKEKERYIRVKLDTEDYRHRRKETLESLARNIAYKVKRSKRQVSLEPMNPYERRIIHSALQNDKFVATRSEGEEPFRHVIVYLKNDYRSNGRDGYRNDYRK